MPRKPLDALEGTDRCSGQHLVANAGKNCLDVASLTHRDGQSAQTKAGRMAGNKVEQPFLATAYWQVLGDSVEILATEAVSR
jgi:hypothetical protein